MHQAGRHELSILRHSSLAFAAAALLLFLACLWLAPSGGAPVGHRSVAEFDRLYGYVGSDDQRWAHFLALFAATAFSWLAFVLSRRNRLPEQSRRPFAALGGAAAVAVAAAWLLAYGFWIPFPLVGWAAVLSLCWFLLVLQAPRLSLRGFERVLTAMIGIYVALLVVPGMLVRFIPLLEIAPDALAQLEAHLAWLPMRGSAIAAGQQFFREVSLGYGLLMPSIMSVVDAKLHGLSIGTELRFVQGCQVLFCVLGAWAYLAYRPRNYLGILAALLLAGPYWASGGLGIWHPNQTGFRSLGLPAGLLALAIAGRLPPAKAAGWLGLAAAVAGLMNLETAVALSVGFVVFLVLRTRTVPWLLLLRIAGAAVLALAAYLVVYRLALGRNAFSFESVDLAVLIGRAASGAFGLRFFTSGYEGEGYYLVPFVLFMLAHASYVVIDGFRRLGGAVLPVHAALRAAIAATLLVWLAYYFNSPNWWQLWTHLFLYGFLVIDHVDRRRFGIGSAARTSRRDRLRRLRIAPATLLLLLFLALLVPHTNRHLLKYASGFMYPHWLASAGELTLVSDILMPRDMAAALEKKAATLRELHAAAQGRLVYFTFNVAFTPSLSSLFQRAPYRDMFGEIQGDAAFGGVIADLISQRPATILIDSPEGVLAVSGPRKDYQERIRAAIAPAYRVVAVEDGWQIWRPSR